MLKKSIALFLAVCAVCCCLLPAAAQAEIGPMAVKLNSNIAGCTNRDVDQLIELESDNIILSTRDKEPVYIVDYAGTSVSGEVVAGRTYFAYYVLEAAEGYALPDALEEGDISIACGKGVSVISTQIVTAPTKIDGVWVESFRGLRIYAKVLVDGSFFQRLIGRIHDVILKIRAWSLY